MTKTKINNIVSDFLWNNRLTVGELADKLGVHYATVSRWKNGKPIPRTIELALKRLEVSVNQVARLELANKLEYYNHWRRGAEDIEQPNSTELGILIDEVVEELRK